MRREVLRSLRVLACVSTLLAGTASALATQEPELYGERSPGVALALSLVGTAIPIAVSLRGNDGAAYALMAGGLVLGPVVGYVYAGEAWRGMAHAGVRAAVLGVTFGSALIIRDPNDDRKNRGLLVTLVLGGALATTVLTVLDINRVDDRVRARNQGVAASLRSAYFAESRTDVLVVTWRR